MQDRSGYPRWSCRLLFGNENLINFQTRLDFLNGKCVEYLAENEGSVRQLAGEQRMMNPLIRIVNADY
jgi:hypothetical protein